MRTDWIYRAGQRRAAAAKFGRRDPAHVLSVSRVTRERHTHGFGPTSNTQTFAAASLSDLTQYVFRVRQGSGNTSPVKASMHAYAREEGENQNSRDSCGDHDGRTDCPPSVLLSPRGGSVPPRLPECGERFPGQSPARRNRDGYFPIPNSQVATAPQDLVRKRQALLFASRLEDSGSNYSHAPD